MRGDVEEAVLEMYLFGDLGQKDSRRRNRRTTEQGEDRQGCAVSRIASGLEEHQSDWRERSLWRRRNILISNPRRHLPDEAQMGRERHEHMALLACVGVDEEGFWGGIGHRGGCRLSEKGAAYA